MHDRLFELGAELQALEARGGCWAYPDPLASVPAAAAIGRYLESIGYSSTHTPQDVRRFITQARAGDPEASEPLAELHRQLVARLSADCQGRGLPLSALIEEGSLGLWQAVQTYDLDSRCDFSVYAAWRVRRQIDHALQSGTRSTRLPVSVARQLYRYLRGLRGPL
ncbi:sigma factor [Pseudomonas sp. MBLB4123]|uniref:sigma factor n=1 Tax=Pseudomonas sp. MBLB4123 TaxID=3451557 RepID=UPI003F74FF25